MHIVDPQGSQQVETAQALRAFLARRRDKDGAQVNVFEMGHGQRAPMLTIWVRDDLASLWYGPSEDHPGYISVGTVTNLEKNLETTFDFYGEDMDRPNETVVMFAEAARVAEEFMRAPTLPRSIEWLEL